MLIDMDSTCHRCKLRFQPWLTDTDLIEATFCVACYRELFQALIDSHREEDRENAAI